MSSITKDNFRYLCQLSFKDLEGSSDFSRYCSVCQLNVYNLDMYSEVGREALLQEAKNKGERFCVSVSVPCSDDIPCRKSKSTHRQDNLKRHRGRNIVLMGEMPPPIDD